MPEVSVIIPVYNEAAVILACLESLGRQSLADLEIIVVDDGSTDTTPKLVANLAKVTTTIKLFSQDHRGAGAARNLGAKKARGQILVFVDADMTFDPDFVEDLVAPIRAGKVVGTFSKEEYLANQDNFWAKSWNLNRGLPADRMLPKNYPSTQKVFRALAKESFEAAGGFDETVGYTDDSSLAAKLGQEAQVVAGAKFYHQNPDNLKEVFFQSKWMAKRKYKLGILGYLIALLRVSLPISVILGFLGAIYFFLPGFVVFRLVSDFGQFVGILEYLLLGKTAK